MNARATNVSSKHHTRWAGGWRRHAWCVRDSLHQLARRPLGSGLTIAVMGIALALPLAFFLVLTNVQQFALALGNAQSVNVFLAPTVTASGAEALAQTLRARADVGAVTVRTPQQGLNEMAALQGFGAVIKSLPGNPLPFVLLIEPRPGTNRAQVETLVAAVRTMSGVDLVQDSGTWRARLDALLALGRRVAALLALLLGAAAVLVIGNTVRLDIRGRADEIAVQQLLGASAAFVRRPFLYAGAWYGLAAGFIAVVLVLVLEVVLAAPVRDLVASYAGRLRLGGLGWVTLAVAWLVAIALGWLGAFIASSRHLARLRA